MDDRYEYSVIDVCEGLHGHACGSGDPMSDTTRALLREWLQRRVSEAGWVDPTSSYDWAVKRLATAALAESITPPRYPPSGFGDDVRRLRSRAQHAERRLAAVTSAVMERRGNHDHDGTRSGCLSCTLIRELGEMLRE